MCMKKLLFLICLLFLILCALSACKSEKYIENSLVETSSQEVPEDTSNHIPDTQPPEYSKEDHIASGRVHTNDLGMQVLEFKNSNPFAVEIVSDKLKMYR